MAYPGETEHATEPIHATGAGETGPWKGSGQLVSLTFDGGTLGRVRIYDSKLASGHAAASKRLLVDITPGAKLIPFQVLYALGFGEGIGLDITAATEITVEIYRGVRQG